MNRVAPQAECGGFLQRFHAIIIQVVRRRAAGSAMRMEGMGAWNGGRRFVLFASFEVLDGRAP